MSELQVDIRRKLYPARTPGSGFLALESLEFRVGEGEFVCLVGPSGCGKTTLLNIVSGLDPEVDGKVRLPQSGETGAAIGYMFQTPRLLPWLSVLDNVRFVLSDRDETRALRMLREMGLEEVTASFPNRLSGGMQRRVALARAFVIDPDLLLLDEPFLSLNVPVAERLRRLLLELWQKHRTTVLFVTHDLREALQLADRVLFLSSSPGRIVLDQPVELPRPRDPEGPALEAVRRHLLAAHPALLSGLVAEPEAEEVERWAATS